jgi:Holliday junction resolvase RusA-like endonuclease
VPIKSKKALAYMKAFGQQCPVLDPLMDGDLAIAMMIYYRTRRPDLDESLILDLLQGSVYKNDRAVKLKYVEHGLSKADPRVVMAIGPLSQASEVIAAYKELVGRESLDN